MVVFINTQIPTHCICFKKKSLFSCSPLSPVFVIIPRVGTLIHHRVLCHPDQVSVYAANDNRFIAVDEFDDLFRSKNDRLSDRVNEQVASLITRLIYCEYRWYNSWTYRVNVPSNVFLHANLMNKYQEYIIICIMYIYINIRKKITEQLDCLAIHPMCY